MSETLKFTELFGPKTGHILRKNDFGGALLYITTTSPTGEVFIRTDALNLLKALRHEFACEIEISAPNANLYDRFGLDALPEKEVQKYSGVPGFILTPADLGFTGQDEEGMWVRAAAE